MERKISINGRTIDLEKPLISLDLEFSVLDVFFRKGSSKKKFKTFEIIEMGFIRHHLGGSDYSFEDFIKPKFRTYKIDDKIKELTGIDEKDLKDGISFEESYRHFRNYYIPGKTYLLTWGNGDLPVLKRMCEKYNLPFIVREEDFIDISKEFHHYYDAGKMYQYSLEKALEFLSIKSDEKHRAIADADAALKVFFRLLKDAQSGCVKLAK